MVIGSIHKTTPEKTVLKTSITLRASNELLYQFLQKSLFEYESRSDFECPLQGDSSCSFNAVTIPNDKVKLLI